MENNNIDATPGAEKIIGEQNQEILPNNEMEHEKENPIFAGSDQDNEIDNYLNKHMNIPQAKEGDEKKETSESAGDEPAKQEAQKDENHWRKMGKTIFFLLDYPLTFGAALIAGEERTKYQVSKEEKEQLIEAWGTVAEMYDWKKPPAWLIISIFMSVAYSTLYFKAIGKAREKAQTKRRQKKAIGYPFNPVTKAEQPGTAPENDYGVEDVAFTEIIDIQIPKKPSRGQYNNFEKELVNIINKQKEALKKASGNG